jgi:tetratricopeptide (TPR) repeat protein
MAFHKARALQEAEKCVAQGKLSQAIKLYLDILEHDASDVSLYNTVGDLCIRDRNTTEGLRQFHKLAEAYVQQGFNVKAIAIYRKISKIDPNSVDVLLKLAELYQLQGLGREAREQYLQAAEFFKRRSQTDRTLDVLHKLILLDPESTNFRNRLAAECEQAGKREDAVVAYMESAEASLRHSDLASADAALKKAAELDAKNPKVQLLRARVAIARHLPEEAERIIESSPGLDAEPGGKHILLDAYLAERKFPQAQKLVMEVFNANPSDFTPVSKFADLCLEKDDVDTALQLLSGVSDQLIQMHGAGPLIESLRRVWHKFPQHIPTLELLHRVCERAPDELTLPEVLEALGQAYVQKGDLEKAEEAYQKLTDREPENEHYRGRLEEILRKLGKEELPARSMDFEAKEMALAPEPETDQGPLPIDDAQQAMVREALDNSDLFARYNLVEKAVAELEKVLQVYPDQIEIHLRILEICRKGFPERAIAAASALANISAVLGDEAALHRYQAIASGKTNLAEATLPPPTPVPTKAEPVAAPPAPPVAPPPVPTRPPDTSMTAAFPVPAVAAGEAAAKASAAPVEIPFDLTPAETPSEPPATPPSSTIELDLSGDFEAIAGLAAEPALPVDEVVAPVEMSPPIEEAPVAPPWEATEAPVEVPAPTSETSEPLLAEAASFDFEDSKIEVDFYLDNGFVDEARKTVATLEEKFPGNGLVAELRQHLEERTGGAPGRESAVEIADTAPAAPSIPEPPAGEAPAQESWDLPPGFAIPAEPPTNAEPEIPPPPVAPTIEPPAFFSTAPQAHAPGPEIHSGPVSPPSASEFKTPPPAPEVVIPPPEIPSPAPEPAVEAPVAAADSGMDLLGDMAGDFASSLDGLAAPEEPGPPPREVAQPAAPAPQGASQLSGLLAEMEDTGASAATADDPETHYNLGVAFREMGLLDESIGEFQKVVKIAGKGHFPANFLQACSLLAICFMEKKMPAIAVKWYLRALEVPGLEEEATQALQYDLGVAYELSGDARHALERFTEVYSQNIDFRDVAEKIRELQQKS